MYEVVPDLVGYFDPRYPDRTKYATEYCKADSNGEIFTYGTLHGRMSGVTGVFSVGEALNNVELTGPNSFFLDDSFPNDDTAFKIDVREKFIDIQIGWDSLNDKVMKISNIPTGWSLGYAQPFSIRYNYNTLKGFFGEANVQVLAVIGENGANKAIQFTLDNRTWPYTIKVERFSLPGGDPGKLASGWSTNFVIMEEIIRRHNLAELAAYQASTNTEIRELKKKVNSLTSIDSSMFISR